MKTKYFIADFKNFAKMGMYQYYPIRQVQNQIAL